jgi:hypothetical protein
MKSRSSFRLDVNRRGKLFKLWRTKMKIQIKLIAIFGVILISSISFAFTNLCNIGNDVLSKTSAQSDEYFQRNLLNRRVTGEGVVDDVEAASNKKCFIFVRCENDVFAKIAAEFEGSIKDLKMGQSISFTGECIGFEKTFYQNSDKKYVIFTVDNPSLRY